MLLNLYNVQNIITNINFIWKMESNNFNVMKNVIKMYDS